MVGSPQWHRFPGPGGVTGLALLSESHLTIHTFPELGFAALNLYTCRDRAQPDWESLVKELLGAKEISIRELRRGTGGSK